MSIIAYVGLPGSGKSYDVVANQILPALKEDRRVVTNVPLDRDEVRKLTLKGEIVDLPIEVIAQEPHKIDEYATAGCLLVIDELWRLWPAGEKANRIPQPFKSLLAEHRHRVDSLGRSMQIVFVTQDLSQVAAFARQLVEQTFHHTKLSHIGARGSYRIDVFHGCVTGAVPPVNNRLREVFGKYDPKIFKLYKSHTMSDSRNAGADEKAMDLRGNIWRKQSIWVGVAFVIVAVIWGTSSIAGLLGGYGVGATSAASSTDAVPAPKATVFRQDVSPSAGRPSRPLTQSVPGLSPKATSQYRLVGTIRNEDQPESSVAMLTDGQRYATIPLSSCEPIGAGEYQCSYDGREVTVFGSR